MQWQGKWGVSDCSPVWGEQQDTRIAEGLPGDSWRHNSHTGLASALHMSWVTTGCAVHSRALADEREFMQREEERQPTQNISQESLENGLEYECTSQSTHTNQINTLSSFNIIHHIS